LSTLFRAKNLIGENIFTAQKACKCQNAVMSKNTVIDFDLPDKAYDTDIDFVPYKETDPERIAFIQAQPAGYKILHDQHIGLDVGNQIFNTVSEPEDIVFTAETLAYTGLGTAWYLFARGARVQRRRLKLEKLATDDPEQRPSALMLRNMVKEDYREALTQSNDLLKALRSKDKKEYVTVPKRRISLGRIIGHASLTLACVPIGDSIGYDDLHLTDAELQLWARDTCKNTLEKGRVVGRMIGK
jgi:hypothetical protein